MSDIEAQLLSALKAAHLWLNTLVDQIDIDPEDTAYTATIVSPDGKREAAKRTLAESLAQIDAAISNAEGSEAKAALEVKVE